MRNPVVAGQFYPADKTVLVREVKSFIGQKQEKKPRKIYGVIVPHAGYVYSGKCACKAYNLLNLKDETIVLLGVNHSGYGENIAISIEDFETPLGIVKNDKELGKEIASNYAIDENAHKYEHSLEVQLPFLQQVSRNIKIVPIILKNYNYEICRKLAQDIHEASKKLKREIIVIASSDFTHYGYSYGFVPFTENVKENLYKLDKGAIKLIEEMNAEKFLKYSEKTTICGAGAITTCIELCKLLGAEKAELVDYYTSGEISGDYDMAVGYAGLVFV